ncbi:hypothetical protein [Paenibacillus bouchesdurhonensis]|uniref:hypothetical protein n=1 Tax=Paenibacillus bouchesdurhonensis TaxID=1870990 RepID=UPI000DA621E8|nr:hypothetical protein [Paenibacillus bouchesdurhonensis]
MQNQTNTDVIKCLHFSPNKKAQIKELSHEDIDNTFMEIRVTDNFHVLFNSTADFRQKYIIQRQPFDFPFYVVRDSLEHYEIYTSLTDEDVLQLKSNHNLLSSMIKKSLTITKEQLWSTGNDEELEIYEKIITWGKGKPPYIKKESPTVLQKYIVLDSITGFESEEDDYNEGYSFMVERSDFLNALFNYKSLDKPCYIAFVDWVDDIWRLLERRESEGVLEYVKQYYFMS